MMAKLLQWLSAPP